MEKAMHDKHSAKQGKCTYRGFCILRKLHISETQTQMTVHTPLTDCKKQALEQKYKPSKFLST